MSHAVLTAAPVAWPIPSEETANRWTHGLGLAASVYGAVPLVVRCLEGGDFWQTMGCSIYAVSLVALYTASTVYHSAVEPHWRKSCQFADHACIYLLIAGTYTPLTLTFLRDDRGWLLFGLVWCLAGVGIVLKYFFWERAQTISTALYLAMGYSAVLVAQPMLRHIPLGCLAWIAAGGLCYSTGVVFFVRDRVPYFHAVWHLFVMAGGLCHYLAIAEYVAP